MYVPAPRTRKNGRVDTYETTRMNIAPSGTGHEKAGYLTEQEAIEAALRNNTDTSDLVAIGARDFCQNGVVDYTHFKNTPYRSSYLRRRWLQRSYFLCRHYTSGRYYCESVPIRLGTAGLYYTGWLENTRDKISPWTSSLDFEAVLNRAIMENCRRRGIVECKQKMLESKMDLAETLVDIDKTVLSIAEAAWKAFKAFQFARKGNWKAAAETLGLARKSWNPKTIADGWLSMQYGWLPLLSDIYSGVEVVKDILSDPLAHHTYAMRRTSDGLWSGKPNGDSKEWLDQKSAGNATVEVETKFRFRVNDAVLAYITGFKLSNPLYVAWVAAPLTFIVDWFLPVGDWLDSLTATHGLKFVDGYQTTKTYASVTVSGVKRITWRHIWTEVRPVQQARSIVEVACIERSVFSGWPMSLTFFKFPFSSPQRIASAIALTRSLAG